jgi:hypothetical protein
MEDPQSSQDLVTISGALAYALSISLRSVAELSGPYARDNIELLRDQVIDAFKNAEVPAERDLDQAKIVRPALRVLNKVFDDVLDEITQVE